MYFFQTLHTNLPYALKAAFMDRNFENKDVNYVKGDEVGMFQLGSTVVLIYEVSDAELISLCLNS